MGAPLTIAIPFYSGDHYLKRAVESVVHQDLPNWRLLVIDDAGPEDSVPAVLRQYQDERIRYLRNPNTVGMAANWNLCLDRAETDLVTILHADDELEPHYTRLMLGAASQHPRASALFCRARIIGAHSQPRFSFPDTYKRFLAPRWSGKFVLRGRSGLGSLALGNFIMCPTVCYRKSVLGDRRFQTSWRMVQDFELFTRLLLEGEALVGLPDVAYAYRRHSTSATSAYTANLLRFQEESALYDDIARRADDCGWHRVAETARSKWSVKAHLAYCTLADSFAGQMRGAWAKLRLLATLLV